MSATAQSVGTKSAGDLSPVMASMSRKFDMLLVPILFLAITGAIHIHMMLLGGDWDFWVDWKDRRFWITITPIITICFPAAIQYITWVYFRLPIGATLSIVGLLFGEWMNRYFGFTLWAGFPATLTWPAMLIASALVLDTVLMLSKNWLATAIIGAPLFALLFYAQNIVILAPYHVPLEHMGQLMSVADMIGYAFVRTATPEYLRMIERGTLRTFGGESALIASFFSAFICMLMYMAWWKMGEIGGRQTWMKSIFDKAAKVRA
uniref:Methane monooxygenase protein A2 n=1 Tax=Methylococcaceae bacterium ET-HIRO TaxID=557143 RepID=B9X097_9GAMM|nr:methane monooxygenase protein A2 [Methylococcaceae bacterium ET-HIRO]